MVPRDRAPRDPGYMNLELALIRPLANQIKMEWVRPHRTDFLHKHILARGGHLALVPATLLTCALDIIVGLGSGMATIATLGMHRPTFLFALGHWTSTNSIVAQSYKNLLRTINPEAEFGQPNVLRPGIISYSAKHALLDLAVKYSRSHNLLERHVASRLTYALTVLAVVITRAVDAVIGIIAASLSLVTFGTVEWINDFALHGLEFPGVAADSFFCLIRCINPQA